jgi:hypothetical protein
MPRYFADLHCHPTLYSFNRMRNDDRERDPAQFTPWNVLPSNLRHMAQSKRANEYCQCGYDKLCAASVRLTFASITPIERGFFQGNVGSQRHSFVLEAARLMTGVTATKAAIAAVKEGQPMAVAHEITRVLRNRGPLRQLLQTLIMRYPLARIRHMMSPQFDYWEEFLLEYDFMLRGDGQAHDVAVEHVRDGRPLREKVSGRVTMVRDAAHMEQLLDGSTEEVAVVLTIEGGHTFSIAPDESAHSEAVIMGRIAQLKALTHPIFFITIAHHFDNGFCGHAHSIPDAAFLVMDQRPRMHEGFEREGDLGLKVVRALLSLTPELYPTGEGRILIDCKHMSPLSRKEYYHEIVDPVNAARGAWDEATRDVYPEVPVIFSHGAYSGIGTLDEVIESADLERDNRHIGDFYAWGINLCDDDVRAVHRTGGLVGLVFERRVAGVKMGQKLPDDLWPKVLVRQLLAMVDVIYHDERLDEAARRTIWDNICIGSDYDGFIDPIQSYPTVMELPRFAEDLRRELRAVEHTRSIGQLGVDELVEKICWRNADQFARKHLPAARPR